MKPIMLIQVKNLEALQREMFLMICLNIHLWRSHFLLLHIKWWLLFVCHRFGPHHFLLWHPSPFRRHKKLSENNLSMAGFYQVQVTRFGADFHCLKYVILIPCVSWILNIFYTCPWAQEKGQKSCFILKGGHWHLMMDFPPFDKPEADMRQPWFSFISDPSPSVQCHRHIILTWHI